MAVTFGNNTNTKSVSSAELTFSHVVSGSDTLLVVGVGMEAGSAVTGVTYNTVAMTDLGFTDDGNWRVYLFYLKAPADGDNDVVVSFDGTVESICGASSFAGVDQTTPIDDPDITNTGSSATPTVDVVSVTDDMIVDCVESDSGATGTPGDGQTLEFTDSSGLGVGMSHEASNGTVTMDWTFGSAPWIIQAVNINAAAAAGGFAHSQAMIII